MVVLALVVWPALAGWWLTRLPTGFLPIEDQGYVIVGVQLPDGASLERTDRALAEVNEIAEKTPGVDHVVIDRRHLGPRQQRDAGQRRRRLRHLQAIGASAAAGRGPAIDLSSA